MKKFCLFLVCLLIVNIMLTGCKPQKKSSMVQSQRRFEKYFKEDGSSKSNINGAIDLSEGPRLRYDAKLGPKDLNFEFKIINPY